MKKIFVLAIVGIFLYSCSKKVTSGASTAKSDKPVITAAVPEVAAPREPVLFERKRATTQDQVPPNPAAKESVPANNKETPQIVAGKVTYKTKCGKCHDLKDPQFYNATRWVKIIDWMAPNANLDATEKANVLAFVTLYAKA
jgi:hypothetical protein